ncbi:MAG TPA: ribbon-helix-helix protein, CopG family [Bryobacteraceae bacterium]|nr:ribbon-helix-helix protein, CopG family [Bryobacteraceae bacterium]
MTIRLDPAVALALEQMAQAQHRSQAELIRDALSAYTKRGGRPLPSGLGAYDSGESDVSKRAEEILADAA